MRYYAISTFTDGSKKETGTGSGVFSDDLDLIVSLRMPNTFTVFQAENYAINFDDSLVAISQF